MAKKQTRRKRRAFTPEFKAEAVRLCKVGDRSVRQVAKDLDLTETALRECMHSRWSARSQKSLLRQGERVMYQLVDAEKAHHPVRVLCEALGVSRSGFYAWRKRPPAARVASDEQLAVEIAATHAKSTRRYGSPGLHRALRKRGIRVGKKRVARLMRANGIVGRRKRRFRLTTDSNHPNPIAPNLVARDFAPAAPNTVWALADTKNLIAEICARQRIEPGQLGLHADRGSAMTSKSFAPLLSDVGVTKTHSRPYVSNDNPFSESAFKTLEYRPGFPDRFGCEQDASRMRAGCEQDASSHSGSPTDSRPNTSASPGARSASR